MFEVAKGRISLPKLDPGEVDTVNAGLFGEALLRPPFLGSELAYAMGEGLGGRRRRGRAAGSHAEMVLGAVTPLNKL